jgi:hypothetical protein
MSRRRTASKGGGKDKTPKRLQSIDKLVHHKANIARGVVAAQNGVIQRFNSRLDSADEPSSLSLLQTSEFANTHSNASSTKSGELTIDEGAEALELTGSSTGLEGSQSGSSVCASDDSVEDHHTGNHHSPTAAGSNLQDTGINSEFAAVLSEFERQHRLELPIGHALLIAMVDKQMAVCKEAEPVLTSFIEQLADEYGGMVFGLGFRIKGRDSVARKVLDKWRSMRNTSSSPREAEGEFAAVISRMNDILRYTLVFTTAEYTHQTKACLKDFEGTGVCPLPGKLKNFWRKPGQDAAYMGINGSFGLPMALLAARRRLHFAMVVHGRLGAESGLAGFANADALVTAVVAAISVPVVPFELQFHTPQSIDTKMQRCHVSYEKFRTELTDVKRQYWEEMVRMWSLVPLPQNVETLGELAVHDVRLERGLDDGLTEEQLAEKEATALMEALVKPMCDEVVIKAVEMEAFVTPVMQAVANMHGGVLHGLDFRVKSALTMMRKVLGAVNATDSGKRELDQAAIDRAVLREKRNALRYTLVLDPKVPPKLPEHTRPRTARSVAVCPVSSAENWAGRSTRSQCARVCASSRTSFAARVSRFTTIGRCIRARPESARLDCVHQELAVTRSARHTHRTLSRTTPCGRGQSCHGTACGWRTYKFPNSRHGRHRSHISIV